MEQRTATVKRTTKETDIACTLNIDGSGKAEIDTRIPFFDHMLEGFTRHGLFDLSLSCRGDIEVDSHHSIEDCGIVIGEAIKQALGEKRAIKRFGSFIVPMDDVLVLCAIDLSGRPFFSCNAEFSKSSIGTMDSEMVREFFYAVSYSGMMNLHIKHIDGTNNHHIAEACFKAFGKALDMASSIEERLGEEIWSTKGTL